MLGDTIDGTLSTQEAVDLCAARIVADGQFYTLVIRKPYGDAYYCFGGFQGSNEAVCSANNAAVYRTPFPP
jgi:hypothetical protein